MNTEIAVVGDRDLQERLTSALPGFHFVHWSETTNLLTRLKERNIGTVVASIPHRGSAKEFYRTLAHETALSGIITLFWAESQERAHTVLDREYFHVNVGVVSTPPEVKPMINLLWARTRPQTLAVRPVEVPGAASDLDDHPFIKQTTSFLRNKANGRLDVKKIAELYEEPLKRFAEVLGVTPAAVSSTPDSKGYQARLGYFEGAARIIPLLESSGQFAQWAKTPNRQLKGRTPVELLFGTAKDAQHLIDTVEDVLVGQPD